MKKISLALYVLAFGIAISSCNDPSPIGSELLEDDQVDVFFTDTISLIASTAKEDNILTYDPDPSITYDNFLIGDYADPVFGNAVAGLYAQLVPDFDPPDYENAVIDSVVLTLQYDSSGTYGILDQDPFNLGVFRITDAVDVESDYFSDDFFMVDESMPLAIVSNFTPAIATADSITGLIDYRFDAEGDTIAIPASLRISLPLSLGQEFVDYDSTVYTSNTNFAEQFRGIHVRPLSSTPGMLSLDISNLSVSGLTVYYKQDGTAAQYQYDFSTRFAQFNNFKHDFNSAVVENFFDDTLLGDSLLFVQSMSGPNAKIEIPNADDFSGVIVNKAELLFTVAELPEDDPDNYPPTSVLIAVDLDENDAFSFVTDILAGGNDFGGGVMDGEGPQEEAIQEYSMNISAHFQEIIEGQRENTIYLRSFPKQQQASRTVIYGPGHSTYPMRLKLTYTTLD